ncbi:hypothetical protein PG989_004370 [Apiospora arundinis]
METLPKQARISPARRPTIKTFWEQSGVRVDHTKPIILTTGVPRRLANAERRLLALVACIELGQQHICSYQKRIDNLYEVAYQTRQPLDIVTEASLQQQIGQKLMMVLKHQTKLAAKLRHLKKPLDAGKEPAAFLSSLWSLYGPLYDYADFQVAPDCLLKGFNPYADFGHKDHRVHRLNAAAKSDTMPSPVVGKKRPLVGYKSDDESDDSWDGDNDNGSDDVGVWGVFQITC